MSNFHGKLERNSIIMLVGMALAVSVGGLVEIVPLFKIETTIEKVQGMRPYTPLELAGQNIYMREGCYLCHSQQIRPLRDEVERYGHYSLAAESMYDHPFQWGSERTGPDLSRVGGKYSDEWHVAHLTNPRSVVPESIMPPYEFLKERAVDLHNIGDHLATLKILGVPYTEDDVKNAYVDAVAQGTNESDTSGLAKRYGDKVTSRAFDGQTQMVSEMSALIAYLQRLGNLVDFTNYNPDIDPRNLPDVHSAPSASNGPGGVQP
jgi:cytochrome c oxidase cbb3-type subunit 2